jgi:hypothetical protein
MVEVGVLLDVATGVEPLQPIVRSPTAVAIVIAFTLT